MRGFGEWEMPVHKLVSPGLVSRFSLSHLMSATVLMVSTGDRPKRPFIVYGYRSSHHICSNAHISVSVDHLRVRNTRVVQADHAQSSSLPPMSNGDDVERARSRREHVPLEGDTDTIVVRVRVRTYPPTLIYLSLLIIFASGTRVSHAQSSSLPPMSNRSNDVERARSRREPRCHIEGNIDTMTAKRNVSLTVTVTGVSTSACDMTSGVRVSGGSTNVLISARRGRWRGPIVAYLGRQHEEDVRPPNFTSLNTRTSG
ncbi:hypothetical protein L210DRAFT_2477099 [Boletus edulis BED1]|uniref:Uncharacterized protein n=1 Tax=Boletus edulis BED1 TaxID=1328754 RepID=A0AAD4BP56_BOLED|nr:hypothetical protein L210DRAFT_2477099 [Boletus edulis BED1]